ncbi:MAG TPA: serine/threonine-protein kinase [Polyangia bacterium]|nr:serine/threonine-protein kinase [Polyangia bacterium]
MLPRGAEIGRYVVLGLVGRGGMGDVYAAYDPELDRKVAVKLLRARQSAGQSTSEGRTRLLREAQAIAKLSHPNVVVVYDVGTFNEVVFIAMEFIEGDTVRYWLNAAARDWREVLRVFIGAGHGLAAAHQAEIIHRDFKPDNVMVGRDGKVRVMDFGLARQTTAAELAPDSPGAAALAALRSSGNHRRAQPQPEPDSNAVPVVVPRSKQVLVDVEETRVLPAMGTSASQSPRTTLERSESPNALETSITQTGAMLGTPAYMAPEQFASKAGDARTDQFSFCVALYESLYGERPFEGKSFMALMTSVARGIVRDAPARSKVPSWIRKVLVRGLSSAAEARFPSMTALLRALEHDPSVTHRRWATGAVAALFAGGLIFTAARSLQARHNPCEGGAAKLAGVWEPGATGSPRKNSIHAAFAATKKGYAERAFETVQQALDKYTDRWTTTYTDACEATAVRGEQSPEVLDLRMSCLQGRLDSVKALTDVFARADGSTVENAANAIAGLGDLDRCSDLALLRAVVRPPDDLVTQGKVKSLAPRLARVKALSDAGHLSEALALARPLAAEARSVGYLPTTALALSRLAELSSAEPAAMVSLYEESIWAAQSGGDDELVAEAALFEAYAVGYLQADTRRARLWLQLSQATLGRLRGHELLRAWVLNNEALLAEVDGHYEESVSLGRRALELKERLLGPDHPDVGLSLGNIGNVLAKLGRVSEALELSERGLRIKEKALGADHPVVARELLNRSEQLIMAKRFAEAEQLARRALQTLERELDSGDPVLAAVLAVLGRSLLEQNKTHEARPLLERAYAIRVQAEKDPARRAESAFLLAQILWHNHPERPKALTLAIEAKRDYASSTDKDGLAGVERWLHDRDAF